MNPAELGEGVAELASLEQNKTRESKNSRGSILGKRIA